LYFVWWLFKGIHTEIKKIIFVVSINI